MGYMVLMIGTFDGCLDDYRRALHDGGFGVIRADAHDATRLLPALRPAVCVLDIRSLGERGWDLCKLIRSIPTTSSATLLLLAETDGYRRGVLAARARHLRCTMFSTLLTASDFVDCVATLVACGRLA
jgi:DNA-binding response OmpR family regulator